MLGKQLCVQDECGGSLWRTIANKTEILQAKRYQYPEFDIALRPEVGTQSQFRRRKPAAIYRYDSLLSPSLAWDSKNSVRGLSEWLLVSI
jgi:hypothetical protein